MYSFECNFSEVNENLHTVKCYNQLIILCNTFVIVSAIAKILNNEIDIKEKTCTLQMLTLKIMCCGAV